MEARVFRRIDVAPEAAKEEGKTLDGRKWSRCNHHGARWRPGGQGWPGALERVGKG